MKHGLELTSQEVLEEQYAALLRGVDNEYDVAIHLARFAEARIFVVAERLLTEAREQEAQR